MNHVAAVMASNDDEQPPGMRPYRPFTCDTCFKAFTRSENLERHKRTRHGGVARRNFECSQCHARFARSDVCKRHIERCKGTSSDRSQRRRRYQDQLNEELAREERGDEEQTEQDDEEEILTMIDDGKPSFQSQENGWHNQHHQSGVDLVVDDSWQEHQQQHESSSLTSTGSTSSNGETVAAHIKAYFENFHPSLPILHRPTFAISSTPKPLLTITGVIGSLYCVLPHDNNNLNEGTASSQWCENTWETGYLELQQLVSLDSTKFRKTWVTQTWLLYIVYGAYMGDTTQFEKVKNMLRTIVDASRELGLLQQNIAMPDSRSWLPRRDMEDSKNLYERWMSFVDAESMKLCLYTLLFLDSQIFAPCNSRSLLSSLELGWELPFSSKLWEANNSQIWSQRLTEQFGVSALLITGDFLYDNHNLRGIATASLSIATQQLMTDAPDPELLMALAASPVTTLFMLSNLGSLVRDFTRCYYQLPPSLSDPSAFHILTQSQNKQIYTAIQLITNISKDQAHDSENQLRYSMWRNIELLVCSIKVMLCKPDNLLIGGIVDNSLIAGMATSTHLTLGRYVAARRSAPSLSHPLEGEEGIVVILNDLSNALLRIAGDSDGEDADYFKREAPWVTVSSYGILLCIWAAIRRASINIRTHLDTFNALPRMSESCMLILNTIMEPVTSSFAAANAEEAGVAARDQRLWTTDAAAFSSLVDQAEGLYVALIQRVLRSRACWRIGPCIATILEEINGSTN